MWQCLNVAKGCKTIVLNIHELTTSEHEDCHETRKIFVRNTEHSNPERNLQWWLKFSYKKVHHVGPATQTCSFPFLPQHQHIFTICVKLDETDETHCRKTDDDLETESKFGGKLSADSSNYIFTPVWFPLPWIPDPQHLNERKG